MRHQRQSTKGGQMANTMTTRYGLHHTPNIQKNSVGKIQKYKPPRDRVKLNPRMQQVRTSDGVQPSYHILTGFNPDYSKLKKSNNILPTVIKDAKRFLKRHELSTIQEEIIKCIQLTDRGKGPAFRGCYAECGCLLILCFGTASRVWLEDRISNMKLWEGSDLRVVNVDDAFNSVFAEAHILETDLEADVILRRLHTQNGNLNAMQWKILDQDLRDNGQMVTFSFDKSNLKALEALQFSPYFGFSRININLRHVNEEPANVATPTSTCPSSVLKSKDNMDISAMEIAPISTSPYEELTSESNTDMSTVETAPISTCLFKVLTNEDNMDVSTIKVAPMSTSFSESLTSKDNIGLSSIDSASVSTKSSGLFTTEDNIEISTISANPKSIISTVATSEDNIGISTIDPGISTIVDIETAPTSTGPGSRGLSTELRSEDNIDTSTETSLTPTSPSKVLRSKDSMDLPTIEVGVTSIQSNIQ